MLKGTSSTGKGAKLCRTNLYQTNIGNSLRQTVGLQMWKWKHCGLIEGVVWLICSKEK